MKKEILRKLHEIEIKENVKILFAAESGSRAWGFASPDSDYDVRFIYVRPKEEYLRLDTVKDVIEVPINEVLDINGWDLQKTLRLLYKSNPTLFEWFSSPIVYMETEFADEFRAMMMEYFSTKRSLHHYINMAERNYREYLKGDMVRAKKYFYVLRPVLACRWILEKGTPPPMLFSELVESQLPGFLKPAVDELLKLKMDSPEIKEIPRVDVINEYLHKSINEIKDFAEAAENKKCDWNTLNKIFIQNIQTAMTKQPWSFIIVFDEEKAKRNGYDVDTLYDYVNKNVERYGLIRIGHGTWKANPDDEVESQCLAISMLSKMQWVMQNIKSFTAFEDDADEIVCLEVFRRYAPKRL